MVRWLIQVEDEFEPRLVSGLGNCNSLTTGSESGLGFAATGFGYHRVRIRVSCALNSSPMRVNQLLLDVVSEVLATCRMM